MDVSFIKKLHFKMFDETWKWAGNFRIYQTNIGCSPKDILTKLIHLLSDIDYYTNNKTFNTLEIAIRLHHSLAYIHPFPNGNGRHARLLSDMYLLKNSQKPFSWGSNASLVEASSLRRKYINALKEADNYNFLPLLEFALS